MFTRPESWDWIESSNASRRSTRDCQVLCLGSSHTQHSLFPRVIEERSGLKAWNLAMCWGNPAACCFLLERALKAGARPKAVVVEFHPQCVAESYWNPVRLWPHFLGAREILDLALVAHDVDFLTNTLLAKYIPSVKNRCEIRANLLAAFEGRTVSLLAESQGYMRNRKRNRGAIVPGVNERYQGDIDAYQSAALLTDGWWSHAVSTAYIKRLLEVAAKREITVYWLLPPFAPALQSAREESGLDGQFTNYVREFVAKYPNLVVLDGHHSSYEPAVFTDAAHLDMHGGCTLSASVGDMLARNAGQGPGLAPETRWLALPGYRLYEPNVEIENMGQTIASLVVEQRAQARR